MPEHRAPHRRHAARPHHRRVRRGRDQGRDHGGLGRSRSTKLHRGGRARDRRQHRPRRSARRAAASTWRKSLLEGRAFFALIAIVAVFSFLSPNYLTVSNLLTMATHVALFGILAIGMLFVILNGGIDLSVGSTLGLCGVVGGLPHAGRHAGTGSASSSIPRSGSSRCWSVLLGAFIGAINGVLISRFKVPPFVASLGVMYVARGVALLITNGLTYNNLAGRADLGNTGFDWLGFNRLFGVPIGVVVLVVISLIGSVVLNRTAFGRWLYASGGNERAADLSGVPVRAVKISVYVVSGVCAAIAGLILSSQLTSAGPTAGNSYELTAIAAVVIGGAALTGGRGTIRGTLLGAFVIGFLSDGLVIIGVSSYWQTVFTGAVIVLAVMLNAVQYRRRVKRPGAPTANRFSAQAAVKGLGRWRRTAPVNRRQAQEETFNVETSRVRRRRSP